MSKRIIILTTVTQIQTLPERTRSNGEDNENPDTPERTRSNGEDNENPDTPERTRSNGEDNEISQIRRLNDSDLSDNWKNWVSRRTEIMVRQAQSNSESELSQDSLNAMQEELLAENITLAEELEPTTETPPPATIGLDNDTDEEDDDKKDDNDTNE